MLKYLNRKISDVEIEKCVLETCYKPQSDTDCSNIDAGRAELKLDRCNYIRARRHDITNANLMPSGAQNGNMTLRYFAFETPRFLDSPERNCSAFVLITLHPQKMA